MGKMGWSLAPTKGKAIEAQHRVLEGLGTITKKKPRAG